MNVKLAIEAFLSMKSTTPLRKLLNGRIEAGLDGLISPTDNLFCPTLDEKNVSLALNLATKNAGGNLDQSLPARLEHGDVSIANPLEEGVYPLLSAVLDVVCPFDPRNSRR